MSKHTVILYSVLSSINVGGLKFPGKDFLSSLDYSHLIPVIVGTFPLLSYFLMCIVKDEKPTLARITFIIGFSLGMYAFFIPELSPWIVSLAAGIIPKNYVINPGLSSGVNSGLASGGSGGDDGDKGNNDRNRNNKNNNDKNVVSEVSEAERKELANNLRSLSHNYVMQNRGIYNGSIVVRLTDLGIGAGHPSLINLLVFFHQVIQKV